MVLFQMTKLLAQHNKTKAEVRTMRTGLQPRSEKFPRVTSHIVNKFSMVQSIKVATLKASSPGTFSAPLSKPLVNYLVKRRLEAVFFRLN